MTTHLDTTDRPAVVRPGLDREVAMRRAQAEYHRVVDVLTALTPEQWSAPTDCPAWDVRAMAGHMLGMAQMAASPLQMVRQQAAAGLRAKRTGEASIDALTALQVKRNAGLSAAELVAAMRRIGPRAVRGRRRTPAWIRNRTMKDEVDGVPETWTFGYILDVILTRDPFMHRIDIAHATGTPMAVGAEHEGVLVDDVVREWAWRHGRAFELELTGPAGGRWSRGEGGETITMDALEFCRVLSGRAAGAGLLATQVPF